MKKPNLKTATSDELVSWIKHRIRKTHGDNVENMSDVYAVDHGWYKVKLVTKDYPKGLPVGPFQRRHIPAVVSLIEGL